MLFVGFSGVGEGVGRGCVPGNQYEAKIIKPNKITKPINIAILRSYLASFTASSAGGSSSFLFI